MDQKIKKKWVNKLRSGTVRQGKSCLASRDGSGHLRRCCLGVLCDIMNVKRTYKQGSNEARYTYSNNTSSTLLPGDLGESVGLTSRQQERLAEMNDGDPYQGEPGMNFREIADYIDAYL